MATATKLIEALSKVPGDMEVIIENVDNGTVLEPINVMVRNIVASFDGNDDPGEKVVLTCGEAYDEDGDE